MTEHDRLESYMDVIDIDAARQATARSTLETMDLVGLHEHYDELLAEVSERFGWRIRRRGGWRVSEEAERGWSVSESFRRRIADDNAADVEFYQFASALRRERVG
jgi:hypothetical protein